MEIVETKKLQAMVPADLADYAEEQAAKLAGSVSQFLRVLVMQHRERNQAVKTAPPKTPKKGGAK